MYVTQKLFNKIITSARNRNLAMNYNLKKFTLIEIFERDGFYTIHAVYAENSYNENEITITFNNKKVLKAGCNCYYCRSGSPCGHVGVALLYMSCLPDSTKLPYRMMDGQDISYLDPKIQLTKETRKRIKDMNSALKYTDRYIKNEQENFEKNLIPVGQNIKVQLLAEIIGNQISYKIGRDKKYKLKNLSNFMDDIHYNNSREYGKNLSFVHNESAFDEEALAQINYINKEVIACKYSYLTSIPTSGASIDRFYDTYKDLSFGASNCIFETERGHFTIEFIKYFNYGKTYYMPVLNVEKEYFEGNHSLYSYQDNKLCKLIFDQVGKAVRLFHQFRNEDQLFIPEEDIVRFYKYAISDIQEYVTIKGLDDIEFNEVSNVCLYADLNDEFKICVNVKYEVDGIKKEAFDFNDNCNSLTIDKITGIIKLYKPFIDREMKQAIFFDDSEMTYKFISEGLTHLSNYCTVFVSDSIKKIGKKQSVGLNVGVKIENDLLHIDLNSVHINKDELIHVLRAYHKKKKFYRLKNGEVIYLDSEEFEEVDEMLDTMSVSMNSLTFGHFELPAFRAFAMDGVVQQFDQVKIEREKSFDTLIQNFKQINNEDIIIPEQYQQILRDYQKTGFKWMKQLKEYHFNGILADDMGLGKTLQVIALLDSERSTDKLNLVVCPTSLMLNWKDEISKFSQNLETCCIMGSGQERALLIDTKQNVDVMIISYDYLRRDIDLLKSINFEYVILDEAQYIKNQKTKNAICVKCLKAKNRLALTGTPIENSLAELWSIFDFLMPNYLYNYHHFKTNFEVDIVKSKNEKVSEKLKKLVEPFILRRKKKDVLLELPEKVETTYYIDFADEQKKLYLANLSKVNKDLREQLEMNDYDRFQVLAMLTRLRQICCEPRMIYENINELSSKLEGCMDLLHSLYDNGQKTLLFSSFTSALDLIAKQLDEEGISYLMLTGSTDKEKRRELVRQFQEGEPCVFLISLKAGGTGLNLTAAEAVIHFDPWWNMSAQNQATDRAHRIGQKKSVQVYKLIMKDSIEERIMELQNQKKDLADAFVENSTGSITSMNRDQIIELLS